MTSSALNSGAINATPFPSAEQGASVIELLGDVQVTGSISGIALALTAIATTQPTATGVATTRRKLGIGATTAPSAVVTNISPRYRVPSETSVVCVAQTSTPSINVKGYTSASTSATAATTASASVSVKRSASTQPSATSSAAGSTKRVPLVATTTAQASASTPTARSKVRLSAINQATALGAGRIVFKKRVQATTPANAASSSAAQSFIPRSATLLAKASGNKPAACVRLATASIWSAAAVATSGVLTRLRPMAQAAAGVSSVATPEIRITLSAQAAAQAITYSAAADFSVTLPAPPERQIVVPPYDRVMKVVA